MGKLKNIGILILVLSLLLGNLGFASMGSLQMADNPKITAEREEAQEETGRKNEQEDGTQQLDIDTKNKIEPLEKDIKNETGQLEMGTKNKTEQSETESEDQSENESKQSETALKDKTADKEEEASKESEGQQTDSQEGMEHAESKEGDTEKALEKEGLTDIYYEWQTLEEILKLCKDGLDLVDFFQYTIWGFLTREDLQLLVEHGHTLDDVYEAIENGSDGVPEDIQRILDDYAAAPMLMSLGDTRTAGFSGSVSGTLGNIPALGNGSHGPMLKIHLSGETAFCAKFGAACRTGMVYTSVPLSEIGIDDGKERIIRGLLAQYQAAQEIYTGPVNYIMAQAGVWLVQNGAWTGEPEQMAAAIAPLFSKTPDCPSTEFAANYFRAIVEWIHAPENEEKIEAVGLEAWANGPNQYLITATGEGGSLEEQSYGRIEIKKVDSETGNVIADDTKFVIYEWNGGEYERSEASMNREGDTYLSDELFRTGTNEGRFYVEEELAPHTGSITGYYGDFTDPNGSSKGRYEFEIEEGMRGDTISIANQGDVFENRRVTGSIQIYKTDIEADAYVTGSTSHGAAELDGAVYDLYAKEAIRHPDGVSGILYAKDSLVASGTIHEGTCSFEDLYLGSYYVKERQKGTTLTDGKKLSYAEGYLLDESIYDVILPYEGENVRNVHREVHSDKEQVIKAKAVIDKVESAAGQGNIHYMEGAGFTLYRIDKLSRRDSFVKKSDGTYEEESIRKAYLVENYNQNTPKYDFSGEAEAIATVYLRNASMRKDTAFYWQDGMEDLKKGKLVALGNNYYQVAELFSDKNGQIVTPYLPYGQYLVVETSVPKDRFMVPPFVLTFREGRTAKVITTGVTEQTPYGNNFLKSAGDKAASYEAVYFSGIVDNEAVEELLKLYKKDSDTGKTVFLADTEFRIAKLNEATGEKTYLTHTSYYPNTVNRDRFSTNEKGYLQLPELLPIGLYQIEEVEGPNGFYNDIPNGYVQFRVTTEREYVSLLGSGPDGSTLEGDQGNRDVILIIENYRNRETRGELTLRKQGEVLTGYQNTSLIEKIRAFLGIEAKKEFVYEEQPLSGAEYTIRAAEDIITQDRQVDEEGNRTLWFQKGEVAAVVSTGEDGQIDEVKTSTEAYPDGHPIVTVIHEGTLGSVKVYLPLGSYEIEETRAPYGYMRTEEIQKVTFTWKQQFQEFVFNSALIEDTKESRYEEDSGTLTLANARVKAVPKEQETNPGIGIFKQSKEQREPLSDVTFGLYTVDAIYNREGTKLADAGELLSLCTTGVDGRGIFDVDVPIQDEFYGERENTNSGAYEIRELDAPSGVLLDSTPIPIRFTYVDDRTEFVLISEEQENATSEVYVSKQDLTTGEELKGAVLTVTEKWSNKVVQSWVSDGTRKEIRGLAVNENVEDNTYLYILRETAAPDGYLAAEEISFKLVKEVSKEEELKNSVYVYDVEQKKWCRAEENTVVMKDKPEIPQIPDKPEEPEAPKIPVEGPKSHHSSEPSSHLEYAPVLIMAPRTSDTAQIGMYLGLVVLSLTVGGALVWRKWKSRKGRNSENGNHKNKCHKKKEDL